MEFLVDFLSSNVAILLSIIAVTISFISYRASEKARIYAQEVQRNNDKIRVFEKRAEALSEIDKQHVKIETLRILNKEKLNLFNEFSYLQDKFPKEYQDTLKRVDVLLEMIGMYEGQRKQTELVDEGHDIAKQEDIIANIRRTTIHIEERIENEQQRIADMWRLIERENA